MNYYREGVARTPEMLGIRQGFLGDVDAGWEVAYTPAETPPHTHTHTGGKEDASSVTAVHTEFNWQERVKTWRGGGRESQIKF